ncbi:hypothetical protein [Aureimonas fodinaquatilis]|uniref:hypothetical protein n=1 Tax=Aureimonas fodinaquatilis TaxID=2565783 RepID=UPI00165DE8E7|nr:hypothetical protein [Aureimonas fodinaquatilis]
MKYRTALITVFAFSALTATASAACPGKAHISADNKTPVSIEQPTTSADRG